jgi:hypothetical protein
LLSGGCVQKKYIYYSNFNISPLSIIGFILVAIALFFIFLPFFLVAMALTGIAGTYFAWKYKKAVRDFEKNLREKGYDDYDYSVIDITPEKSEHSHKPLPR